MTAAYGNMLPQRFLDIPRLGTLNIHPSLLPAYRGAAPVQRSLQDGVATSGVSLAYTVLACDAGPVLAQHKVGPGLGVSGFWGPGVQGFGLLIQGVRVWGLGLWVLRYARYVLPGC